MPPRRVTKCLLLAAALAAAQAQLHADPNDWPQWRGPDRTAISKETGLLKTWPKGGPTLVWTFDKTGTGYTAPAVVGGVVYRRKRFPELSGNYVFGEHVNGNIWAFRYDGAKAVNWRRLTAEPKDMQTCLYGRA